MAVIARLRAMIKEAGLSRRYGGLHYRFDREAGHEAGLTPCPVAFSVHSFIGTGRNTPQK